MAAVQISLTKTGMVSVITVRMPGREKETPTVVEWAISIAMDKVRGIVAVMDAVTSIGMVAEIRTHLPLILRNPTTSSKSHQVNQQAKIFLTFMDILASFLFSLYTTE